MKTFNIKYERKNGAIGSVEIYAHNERTAKQKDRQLPDVEKVLHVQVEFKSIN